MTVTGAARAAPSTTEELPKPSRVAAVGGAVLVVLIGFALPVLIARHYHALGVPRGDDWSYLRTLFHWIDTGHLNFNNWVSMTLVGQLVIAAPVAAIKSHDIASVQLVTALLGLAGLFATMSVARACGVRRGAAVFLALVVASAPFFGILTVSYMTDVPAFGCSFVSLAIGAVALRRVRVSLPLLAVSFAVGLLAFTIREYAAIPTVAVGLTALYAAWAARDRRRAVIVFGMAGIVTVAAVVFYAYWRTIPGPKPFPVGAPTSHAVSTLNYKGAGILRLAGFWLTPVIALVGPVRLVRRAWTSSHVLTVLVGAATAAWLALTGLKEPRNAFTGNYFIPEGALGRGVGSGIRPRIVPLRLFELFVALGTVAAVVLVIAAVPALVGLARVLRARRVTALDATRLVRVTVALAMVGYTLGYAGAALVGLPLYDRYTLPIAPLAGVLLLAARRQLDSAGAAGSTDAAVPATELVRRVAAGVALLALFGLSLDYTADSASYDAVRWRVSQAVVADGWAPRQIGGNFEWVNYFALQPGFGASVHRYCVNVVVGEQELAGVRRAAIARGTYSSPFRRSLPVVATRSRQQCAPGGTR